MTEKCDMEVGPCACGAWHGSGDFIPMTDTNDLIAQLKAYVRVCEHSPNSAFLHPDCVRQAINAFAEKDREIERLRGVLKHKGDRLSRAWELMGRAMSHIDKTQSLYKEIHEELYPPPDTPDEGDDIQDDGPDNLTELEPGT